MILLLLVIIVIAISTIVFYTMLYGISPMPSSAIARRYILKAIPPEVPGVIYELGSGWGTLAHSIARNFRHNKVIGYEVSPLPFYVSQWLLRMLPLQNLEFQRQDFMNQSLERASVIVCYLYPKAMVALKDKFERELIPGTMIISNTFAVPGWKPIEVYETKDLYKSKIYVYRF